MVYALLVEAYVQTGMNMIEAIERVDEVCGIAERSPEGSPAVPPERVPSEAENDAALAELTKMMMGVGR